MTDRKKKCLGTQKIHTDHPPSPIARRSHPPTSRPFGFACVDTKVVQSGIWEAQQDLIARRFFFFFLAYAVRARLLAHHRRHLSQSPRWWVSVPLGWSLGSGLGYSETMFRRAARARRGLATSAKQAGTLAGTPSSTASSAGQVRLESGRLRMIRSKELGVVCLGSVLGSSPLGSIVPHRREDEAASLLLASSALAPVSSLPMRSIGTPLRFRHPTTWTTVR